MARVLVTGGAGFIGYHIVETFLKENFTVIVIDNLVKGKKENIHSRVRFYEVDIRSKELEDILKKEKIDYVVHQAAQTSVQNSLQDPLYDASVNIIGSLNLLEACRKCKVKKIVYASSAAVYGEPQYLPVDENHFEKPQSAYGISKLVVEKYLRLYKYIYNLDFTVLRYANVYGPGQDVSNEGGVVAIFLKKIKNNEKPVIYGNGKQKRDFIFVKDVARANLLALKRGSGEIINISTGVSTSVNEIFELIKSICSIKCEAIYEKERKGDIQESFLDRKKAQLLLGWIPEISLEQGLKLMLQDSKN